MANPLKVQFIQDNHSTGRGIGVYAENLISSLKKIKGLSLVSKNADIVHYPYFDLFYPTLKVVPNSKTIVTIHDVTPLVMADRYPKGILTSFGLLRQWLSLKKVSAVITDSENSKKDIQKYLWFPEEKIFVTPLAVNELYKSNVTEKQKSDIKKKYNLPDKFILTVAGGPNPNKNLPSLAEVTERLNIPLVIVGGGMNQQIIKPVPPELIDMVRLEVYQHILRPKVPNEDLNIMLRLATAYVQASFYEGFGIPLLEAMTTGCPIASSKTSSLPEVYHPETIVFNPRSLKSMEKAIKKVIALKGSAKEKYIEINKQRSKFFTWKKTAELTYEVYKKINEKNS